MSGRSVVCFTDTLGGYVELKGESSIFINLSRNKGISLLYTVL